MFQFLQKGIEAFYSSPTRLLRFSLNNALRGYLKEEFAENFEVGLWNGEVNIRNVVLDEKVDYFFLNIELDLFFCVVV